MGQVWPGNWRVTSPSSWLFPYNPHRSRVTSLHHWQGSWMEFKPCPWDSLVALLCWHPPWRDASPKNFPIPIPASLYLDSGKIASIREGRKWSKAVQGSSVGSAAIVAVCLLWSVRIDGASRAKQAPVLKGCLMKATSFNFIPCLCASRGSVYLES